MSQETIQENSPPKLIDIDELDAKALLGLEDAGPAISRDQPFRRWLYDWTLNPNIAGNFQKSLDKWVAVLIVANLFALVLEHVPALFEPNKVLFHYFDVFSVCIFVLEYALRFYLAPEDEEFQRTKSPRVAYFLSPFAIIDLLAIAPLCLPSKSLPNSTAGAASVKKSMPWFLPANTAANCNPSSKHSSVFG